MKRFVFLCLLFTADYLSASPLTKRSYDDEVPLVNIEQDVKVEDPKHRWAMVPDSEGQMHLVDLNPYEVPVEPFFTAEDDVVFLLYTRSNPTVGQEIKLNVESISNSNFNKNHPTRFTIHGWNGALTSSVNTRTAEEFFKHSDNNLITVDWSKGAGTIDYIAARNRVSEVGKFTAKFIDFLHENGLVQFEKVHVIGHSLGGQTAGVVGKHVTRGKVQVIIGLDPAGPLFSIGNEADRITPTDGVYVEVIHTNGWTLGFGEPIGQADFFPNFGRTQPGCGIDLTGSCSHGRAPEFYAESINSNLGFQARGCTSFSDIDNKKCEETGQFARMGGEPANVGLRGYFHLSTNSNSPFALG